MALDIQPAQQGRKIEGCPAPCLKRVARQTNAHQLLELDEPDARVLGDPSRDGASRTLADTAGFDQRDLDAGGGERIGGRASRQSTPDDDDVGTEWPFVPGIRRHARTGKPIEERRPAVVNHRLRILCSAAGRAACRPSGRCSAGLEAGPGEPVWWSRIRAPHYGARCQGTGVMDGFCC